MPRLRSVHLDGQPLDTMSASIVPDGDDWTIHVVVDGAWTRGNLQDVDVRAISLDGTTYQGLGAIENVSIKGPAVRSELTIVRTGG